MEKNNTTAAMQSDAELYFIRNRRTINKEEFLDEEDFMKFVNRLIGENASLKEKLSTYQKDYESMVKEVVRVSGELSEIKNSFYINICRAYNAGKECMNNQHEDARNKGAEAFSDRFVSSHDYFLSEFPEFKTNVP